MKRKLLSLVLAFAMTVSLFTVGASATEPTYGDTAGHWAESSIDRWSGYGVVQGSDGDFLPDGELTCAQLATILARLLNLPAAPDAGFSDVAINAWYADAINRCAAAGILNGNGDGTVSPTATISRERAMVMLGRALGVEPVESPDLSKYGDAAKVAPYAQGMVAALIDAGIVGGVTDTELAPTGSINRASTVTILDRAIGTYANTDGATVSATGGLTVVVANDVTVPGSTDRLLVPTSEIDVLLESAGTTDVVTITGSDSTVTIKNTELGGGEVIGDRSRIILDSAAATSVTLSGVKSSVETVGKSTIESVAVTESAAGATVTVGSGATVQTVTNLAADVLVTGDGDVKNVETATDMTVETPDTPVVNIGTDEITVIDREGEDNVLADKDLTKSDSDTVNVDKGSSGSGSSSPVHYHHFVYSHDVYSAAGRVNKYTDYADHWLTHTGVCIGCVATVSGECNDKGTGGACDLCGYKNSEEKPFLIATKSDFQAINKRYEDGFAYYKVADEVDALDLTSVWGVPLYGVFDGNNKTITVDNSLFYFTYSTSSDPVQTTIKNLTVMENRSAGALVGYVNSDVINFKNVKVSGVIERNYHGAAFVGYGTLSFPSCTRSYTLNFENCSCDATIMTRAEGGVAILVGHAYQGKGNTLTINMDNATATGIEKAKLYGKETATGYKYYIMGSEWETGVTVKVDNQEVSKPHETFAATSLGTTAPVKAEDGTYTVTAVENAVSIKVQVLSQLTAYDKLDGRNGITNTNGTCYSGSVTDQNPVTVFSEVTSVEIRNELTASGHPKYMLDNDGKLTITTNDTDNYLTGTIRLAAYQYDANGALISTGTLDIAASAGTPKEGNVKWKVN